MVHSLSALEFARDLSRSHFRVWMNHMGRRETVLVKFVVGLFLSPKEILLRKTFASVIPTHYGRFIAFTRSSCVLSIVLWPILNSHLSQTYNHFTLVIEIG